ncbi:hypothetical protein HSBAA_PA_3340 (plasmid) [Vreelandella sulfidaeris]|uniref:Uncharacterized protein n=1 Tax=Vreelandella sulfidaeris TaxID=115553 RepID=A0A455UM54_9GAMM|nr:hypothetical protein HSBAA_PA_3340 [Halomonas sulfidaeris]
MAAHVRRIPAVGDGDIQLYGPVPCPDERIGYATCAPHSQPTNGARELQRLEEESGHFIDSIFDKRTRIRVKSSGAVQFSDNEREVDVVPLTIDTYPDYLRLYMTGDMLGS